MDKIYRFHPFPLDHFTIFPLLSPQPPHRGGQLLQASQASQQLQGPAPLRGLLQRGERGVETDHRRAPLGGLGWRHGGCMANSCQPATAGPIKPPTEKSYRDLWGL